MIFVLCYMTATETNYALAKDPAIKMGLVAASWIAAIILGSDSSKISFSPQNPAIATALLL